MPPINLLGDFGSGSMLLLVGILAALVERQASGRGQVVDAAMVDGIAINSQMIMSLRSASQWSDARESNLLDGGVPFYRSYRCADDRYVAVGALEPQFFAQLLDGLGIAPEELGEQLDPRNWPTMDTLFSVKFASRPRDAWEEVFATRDACVTPVLTWDEAATHSHLTERGTWTDIKDSTHTAPAPRFSRTPGELSSAAHCELSTDDVLREWAAK